MILMGSVLIYSPLIDVVMSFQTLCKIAMAEGAELRKGWRVLLGTILVYLMCYPGTVLLVVPGLSSVAGKKRVAREEGEAWT